MNVEIELLTYLQQSKALKENTQGEIILKQRNIDLIACFYGFRGAKWPTYEEVAETYDIGTRQRVQQIIKKAFHSHAKAIDFPAVQSCAAILQQRAYWPADAFLDTLTANAIEVPGGNVQGLLNLMHELDLASSYQAYTQDFREMTRTLLAQDMQVILLTRDTADALCEAFKWATDRPSRVGIANLRQLADEKGWSNEFYLPLRSAVALSTRAWSWQDGDNFWYTFEHRKTTFRTYGGKVFSVVGATTAHHLAEVYENALHGRTVSVPFPPVNVIETYLRESLLFQHEGDLIRSTGKANELTDVEHAIVDFFKTTPTASYPKLRDYLLQKHFSKPIIDKQITHSCLVHVDRSLGRGQHAYSLVKQFNISGQAVVVNDYAAYRERLRKLYENETDENCEATRRKEHSILQAWLFDGKVTERCALCGDQFHIGALITAHKKKRANCTTAERLDPHIVMPACALGCDFLYERGYVYVQDGKVQVNALKQAGTAEYQRAKSLSGKAVLEKWLQGKLEYYAKAE